MEGADGTKDQKIVSALLANPEANSLVMPTDGYLVGGLAAAIDQAGLADKLVVVGGFGSEAAIDMIRNGQPGVGLHNPGYDFNDDNIELGSRFWNQLARRWFEQAR